MKKSLLLILVFLMTGLFVSNAQSSLEGLVIAADDDAPLDFAYVKIFKGESLITGTQTDLDGNYLMSNIDPGTYDIEASYIGYTSERKTGVVIKAGKITRLNFNLNVAGGLLEDIVITEYKAPLIEIDNTTSGGTVTAEKIASLPTKSVNAIAASTAGVSSQDGGAVSIRGGRTNSTMYVVDGIMVSGSSVPPSEIEQMQVITGGLAAKYGDATGGLISITTKGPSQRFSGGAEIETSQYLDPYGYNLATAYLSGPIIKNDKRTILGFRFSGQYRDIEDDTPSAVGRYRMPESIISELEAEPVVKFQKSRVPAAIFLNDDDIGGVVKTSPNEDNKRLDLNGKIDARFSDNIDISITGGYMNSENRFTPYGRWRLLNWQNNPNFKSDRLRGSFRLRHKIGKQGLEIAKDESDKKSVSLIRNAYYILNVGYEKGTTGTEDFRHEDNYFNYGYYGSRDVTLRPAIELVDIDTWGGDCTFINGRCYDFVGYTQLFSPFQADQNYNPALSSYNEINGSINDNYDEVWDDLFFNVGKVYNTVSKGETERYNFNISSGFDFLPGGSKKGRHSIELGGTFEMRVERFWNIAPLALWELASEQQNLWIVGVDTNDIVGTFVQAGPDGQDYEWNKYNTKLNINEDSKFYKSVRELLGKDIHDYVNVDGELTPDQLSLEMFSGKEINDKGLLYYYGYDYLGNKLSTDVKFKDFFTEQGREDFWSPAYNPLYGGLYIQDKFSFKDIIMRIGARVDYVDANTKVLKDPYSLYEIENAGDFYAQNTEFDQPESVEDDYKVYVADEGSNKVIGYRKGDQWYSTSGTATDGNLIFKGGLINPYYKERVDSMRNIQASFFNPDISFEDYTPQINFMPRIAFSFPISEDAGFFAHYDVLVQRPSSNNVMTPIQYYYFESKNNQTYNNPNLKPQKTIDYEVGFQQKLSNDSALKIQAYYREMRDMIRVRPYIYIPTISRYNSYGNLDYGTVKGFSFTYDFRRKGNIEFQVAYTLQFAFGTGSSANSAAGTSNRGIIRNLYATDFDERHSISATVDYRYFSGKKYNGPEIMGVRIFENAGVNIQTNASSGRPYTVSAQPSEFGGAGYIGAINGARKPWYFEINLRADKSFTIMNKLRANVYLRVENLLNTQNVLGVYSFSGDPEDDGFLVSSIGQNRIRSVELSDRPIESFYDQYDWRMLNPGFYSRPRRIYLGLTFNL